MGFNEFITYVDSKVDITIASIFRNLSFNVDSFPNTSIIVTLINDAACGSRLAILTSEVRPNKLWLPQDKITSRKLKSIRVSTISLYIQKSVLITTGDDTDFVVVEGYISQCDKITQIY